MARICQNTKSNKYLSCAQSAAAQMSYKSQSIYPTLHSKSADKDKHMCLFAGLMDLLPVEQMCTTQGWYI